jgi:hypothetical protein
MVIARVLEECKALSQTNKHNYFWRGIKPILFCNKIGNVLRNSKLWMDLTNPLPMKEATQAIKLHLKRYLHHIPDDDGLHAESDSDVSTDTADSDDESGSEDSDDKTRQAKNKKSQSKTEAKKEEISPKAPEVKTQESVDLMKSNINNLTEKIGCLTSALGQFDSDKAACCPGRFSALCAEKRVTH